MQAQKATSDMRIRVVFRGLMVFQLPETHLRAVLISHGRHGGVHDHKPRVRFIGREASKVFRGEQAFDLSGRTLTLGIAGANPAAPSRHRSFVDHVPQLRLLHLGPKGREDSQYRAAEVIVPAGVIRARELVTWQVNGTESPAEVRFMNSDVRGHVASETVLEVEGSALTIQTDSPIAGLPGSLTPLAAAGGLEDEVGPDTVEILITNFGPQRSMPVPWSLHYQWTFRFAGYADVPFDQARFTRFTDDLGAAYASEWAQDFQHLNNGQARGQPFPYLRLKDPGAIVPPRPLDDPWDRPLCPQADDGP